MEEEKKLTEEANAPEVKKDDKLFKKPEGKAMYQKQREETDDAEQAGSSGNRAWCISFGVEGMEAA